MRAESASWVENERTPGTYNGDYLTEMAEELLTYPLRQGDNTVWNVYAEPTPGADWLRVGRIEATGSFVRNLWSDQRLFFKHQNYIEDLRLVDPDDRADWFTFAELEQWGDKRIEKLPRGRDDAREVIDTGSVQFYCPFAWLVQDVVTSTGTW